MFIERNVPELMIVEWTRKSALRRQVTVMVLVPEMSNTMKRFKKEQPERCKLGRGVEVMDFIEGIVTS